MNISRRKWFGMAGAAALASGFGAGADTDPAAMIVRSARPTDLEMRLSGFNDAITPIERFFVRCHTYTPHVDIKTWTLKLEGVVNRPVTLTMADLKKLPRVELTGVLECAGNGRSFYQPRVAGTQWAYGSVGNPQWSGLPLKNPPPKPTPKTPPQPTPFP